MTILYSFFMDYIKGVLYMFWEVDESKFFHVSYAICHIIKNLVYITKASGTGIVFS